MIVRGVTLVGVDTVPRDIVLSGPLIARVGDRSTDPTADGPLVDCAGAIAFPGLTNSHDHLEFNLYPGLRHEVYADYVEWGDDIHRRDAATISLVESVPRRYRLRWGALKNVLCGVTTVAHHGDARDELGALPIDHVRATSIHSLSAPHWRLRLNAPARRLPCVFHVAEGTSRRAEREIDDLLRWNLLRRPLVGVHAIAMREDQAKHFRAVVWCPVSNEFLYGKTAEVARWKAHTAVVFGTDSTVSADWNLWNHLRRARALGFLDDRELFGSVTSTAATAWRRPGTGAIAPGHAADLVVARAKTRHPWDAFYEVNPEDILLVLKGGAVVLWDSSLDAAPPSAGFSAVRVGGKEKWIAEDIPDLLTRIGELGVAPNIPIAIGTDGS